MAASGDDVTAPLLAEEGGVRQRTTTSQGEPRPRWTPPEGSDWDPNLPYGGKVYLARRKKPDPLHVRICEGLVILFTVCFAYYAYFYFDHLHYNVTNGYAKLGYAAAQHQIGQRFLHGAGVEKDHHQAMDYFKLAADQGHPHASYNLAVGHLQGIRTDLVKKGRFASKPELACLKLMFLINFAVDEPLFITVYDPFISLCVSFGVVCGTSIPVLEAHKLIAHAAANGVKEAHQALNNICSRGGCE